MKNFLVIFREPDGRKKEHSKLEIEDHQQHWKSWFEKWKPEGILKGGSGLTLNGKIIKPPGNEATDGIHKVGDEIVGGFLLIEAADLEKATEIIQSCPIFEFDGYAEIREMQN